MAEEATKLQVKSAPGPAPAPVPRRRDWPSFTDLRREMDALFEDFGRDWFRVPERLRDLTPLARFDLEPAVDVVENGAAFKVTSELPGMDQKDIAVELAGNVLTIRGEKTETKEEDEKGRFVAERRYGVFQRSFTLPDGVDRERIEATYANGVLTVVLPKTEAAKAEPQKIEVKAA